MKVLVVDDEQTLARAIKRGLEAEGFLTEIVHDGLAGRERALAGEFDVIVLDLMVPGRNGYDVCRDLRRAEVWTPVLILTAKDGEYDEVDAFDLGADDYLTKPFSFPVLVARLRALVRRGGPERPPVLTAGDLTLDPASRSVHRGGTEIALTAREYGVLHHLIRHKGTVVSKLDLLQDVWDLHHDGAENSENIVEVYIAYLRRKIDAPFGRAAIETVRGAGYRLEGHGG
ncbi:response regulator transcription factor [Nocardioides sp.]|uniref:response regulator transcription factor n=1 Tax=Nocardioides sp. TaxID=35761 RepID=UPI00262BB670|nr:response regulator transcription factor [Nocardioides sp.]